VESAQRNIIEKVLSGYFDQTPTLSIAALSKATNAISDLRSPHFTGAKTSDLPACLRFLLWKQTSTCAGAIWHRSAFHPIASARLFTMHPDFGIQ
jgi:hypothetical protein